MENDIKNNNSQFSTTQEQASLFKDTSELNTDKMFEKSEIDEMSGEYILSRIDTEIKSKWKDAFTAKLAQQEILRDSMRQRKGEYSGVELTALKDSGSSTIFMTKTDEKCRAFESWLRDILARGAVPPYDLKSTPIPVLDEEQEKKINSVVLGKIQETFSATGQMPSPELESILKEVAKMDYTNLITRDSKKRMGRMKRIMDDQLAEGSFTLEFSKFLCDFTTYEKAFLLGPLVQKVKQIKWVNKKPIETEVIKPVFQRISPFDVFPEPGIENEDDGYIFLRERMSRDNVHSLIGLPGYDEEKIRLALNEYSKASESMWTGDNQTNEFERNQLENKNLGFTYDAGFLYVNTFWGQLKGSVLKEAGVKEIDDEEKMYPCCCIMIGSYCIKAEKNPFPLGKKPIQSSAPYKIPGGYWHISLPGVLMSTQRMVNLSARELANNMSLAAGAIIEVNIEKLADKSSLSVLAPRSIIQTQNDTGNINQSRAVTPIQIPMNAGELLSVYTFFNREADNVSGIPAYAYGDSNVGGAARTASGMSMMMNSASKGIRQSIKYIDEDIIKPILEKLYYYNMLFNDDFDSKGDEIVIPQGVLRISEKETNMARIMEFMNYTNNPLDSQILGVEGRLKLLRQVIKALDLDDTNFLPSEEEVQLKEVMSRMIPQQNKPSEIQAKTNQNQKPSNLQPNGAQQGVQTE